MGFGACHPHHLARSLRQHTSGMEVAMKTEFIFEWMSVEPITVSLEAELHEAKQLLDDYHIQRLLVVDGWGRLIGIITQSDVLAALPIEAHRRLERERQAEVAQIKVKDVMTANPVTVNTTDTVGKAAILMLTNKISGLPVLSPVDRSLVGIITASDIYTMVAQSWGEIELFEVIQGG